MKEASLPQTYAPVSKPAKMLSEKRFVQTNILSLRRDKQRKNMCAWEWTMNLITPSKLNRDIGCMHVAKTDL